MLFHSLSLSFMPFETMFRVCMLPLLFSFSLFQCSTIQNPYNLHWDYQRYGPDTWKYIYDTCEGEAQSPINIRKSQVRYDPDLSPLSLNGYTTNESLYVWNFTHNGHTIIAQPPPLARLSISGANLPEEFYLTQFHFHWGLNIYQGSEHTINGVKYPLEVHFVHRGRSPHAFAVLSILFKLHHDDNPYINELLSILNETTDASISLERQISISRLFPTASSSPPLFYRYDGSFTSPPCTEGVIWIILARFVLISPSQLEIFVRNSLPSNFRPTQKLFLRIVSANFRPELYEDSQEDADEPSHHSCAHTQQIPILLLSLILLIVIF